MKNIRHIANQVNIEERCSILGDEVLKLDEVADKLLHKANRDRVSDAKAINLINYMRSSEFFQEMESYWFYLYDPKKPETWEAIINHVYKRSITPKYLMN